MLPRLLLMNLVLGLLYPASSIGQQKPETAVPGTMQEFPVVLQHSVTAGKTPVGTKVEARLSIATLVNGIVIPRNAVFSGEVVESAAKSASQPSRISIRMDSVTWKGGSAPVKLYMTQWFYPTVAEGGQNLQYGPPQPPQKTWNGAGAYPDPNSPAYKPFPGGDSDKDKSLPDTPASVTSKHRVLMKNVEAERSSEGGFALVSKHSNIKLDRYTTYVLAAGDLAPVT